MLGGYPPKNRIGLLMFFSAQLYNLGQGALDGCGVALPANAIAQFFMRNLQEKRGIDTAGERDGNPSRLPQQRAQPLQLRLSIIYVRHLFFDLMWVLYH